LAVAKFQTLKGHLLIFKTVFFFKCFTIQCCLKAGTGTLNKHCCRCFFAS